LLMDYRWFKDAQGGIDYFTDVSREI